MINLYSYSNKYNIRMIIKSLKLTNYRRFRNLELELPENTIGILGSNGVGKTTIVESIGWCLYGNRIKRTDKQDIRSQFAGDNAVCSVELIFQCGGHEYKAIRKLSGKNANVEAAIYLNANSDPEAVQERGVNEYITKLLNLDYKSFFISVFAKQRDLAALSILQPEERRKSIARLMNIETIDKAKSDVRADKKSKQDKHIGMESGLKDEQNLKQQKKQLNLDLDNALSSKKELNAHFKNLQQEFQKIKEDFEQLSKLRDQFHQLKSSIDKWKSRYQDFNNQAVKHQQQIKLIEKAAEELEKLKPKLKNYKDIQRKKERLDKLSSKFFQLQAFLEEKKRLTQRMKREQYNLTRLTEELKGLNGVQDKLKEQDSKIGELEKQREWVRQELSKKEGLIENVTAKGKELKQKKERIEKLGPDSPCPVCQRPLHDHFEQVMTDFNSDLSELREQYSSLGHSKKELEEKRKTIDENLGKARTTRDGLLQMNEQFKERDKQIEQVNKSIEELIQNLKDLDDRIKDIGEIEYDEKEHKKYQKLFKELTTLRDEQLKNEEKVKRLKDEEQELDNINRVMKDLQDEITRGEKELKNLNYEDALYLQRKKDVEQQQKQVDLLKEELHKTDQKILSIEKDKTWIHSELNKQADLKKQIDLLKEDIVYLEALDYHLGIFRQDLAGRIRPLIASRASELLHLTTQGRYSILELDEDYNIFIFDQAQRFPLARFSGGEQDLANLCLRIAISQVVAERSGRSQINFIVLDEIFGSQDEQRKDLILKALQQLSSQFRQIFIITHVENIKDALPVLISVEEKNVEESTATLI